MEGLVGESADRRRHDASLLPLTDPSLPSALVDLHGPFKCNFFFPSIVELREHAIRPAAKFACTCRRGIKRTFAP